jgi:hypothetical protein
VNISYLRAKIGKGQKKDFHASQTKKNIKRLRLKVAKHTAVRVERRLQTASGQIFIGLKTSVWLGCLHKLLPVWGLTKVTCQAPRHQN